MSLLRRVLRSGEGRKLRDLQALVPDINALEPEMQRLDDDGLRAPHRRVPQPPGARRVTRRTVAGGLRGGPRVRGQGAGPAPLRRAARGRGGPALGRGGGNAHRRGQDPHLHASRLPHRADRSGCARGDGQRLPGRAGRGVDGAALRVARPDRRADHPRQPGLGAQATPVRLRRDLRDQQRTRLRLSARQHGHVAPRAGAARPSLLHRGRDSTRSSSTRPARR